MHPIQRRFFRNELRRVRARALADAEAYAEPLHALERLGRFLDPGALTLGRASRALSGIAAASDLAQELPERWPQYHRPAPRLLRTVTDSRNDVMHIGARARHLTTHAVEVCLVLEDALQNGLDRVSDFMVSDRVVIERWQPLSLLRQQMLEHSFTFLPIRPATPDGGWLLVADHHLARFLGERKGRLDRLAMSVGRALDDGLGHEAAKVIDADTPVSAARQQLEYRPFLVRSEDRILGIVTAFDLL
jgi:hypothetical protein